MKLDKKIIAGIVLCIVITGWVTWVVVKEFATEINLIEDPSKIKWRGIELSPMLFCISFVVLVLFYANLPQPSSLS